MVQLANLHATVVVFQGKGILIQGPSGSGKSDLALRLIEAGAVLVADDRCDVTVGASGEILASAPKKLKGLLEVRGLGLVKMPFEQATEVNLVVELASDSHQIERMPNPSHFSILERQLPSIKIWPFACSAIAIIKLALSDQLL